MKGFPSPVLLKNQTGRGTMDRDETPAENSRVRRRPCPRRTTVTELDFPLGKVRVDTAASAVMLLMMVVTTGGRRRGIRFSEADKVSDNDHRHVLVDASSALIRLLQHHGVGRLDRRLGLAA